MHMFDLHQIVLHFFLVKKGNWVFAMFRYLCKVNYDNDKFIHGPTYTYNEVLWLLELVDVNDATLNVISSVIW